VIIRSAACYGTLRPGCGNYEWCARPHRPDVSEGIVRGFQLWGAGAGFPYAIPGPGSITVSVLTFPEETWPDALRDLDRLEGFPHHYDRLPVRVLQRDAVTSAWLYTPSDPERIWDQYDQIRSGDWLAPDARCAA